MSFIQARPRIKCDICLNEICGEEIGHSGNFVGAAPCPPCVAYPRGIQFMSDPSMACCMKHVCEPCWSDIDVAMRQARDRS